MISILSPNNSGCIIYFLYIVPSGLNLNASEISGNSSFNSLFLTYEEISRHIDTEEYRYHIREPGLRNFDEIYRRYGGYSKKALKDALIEAGIFDATVDTIDTQKGIRYHYRFDKLESIGIKDISDFYFFENGTKVPTSHYTKDLNTYINKFSCNHLIEMIMPDIFLTYG